MFVHKVEFVGQARCCPGFPVSKEQAARPVPLSHQPYLSGKKLSLSASAQPPNWNVRRHILYIRACAMEEQRHGGNVLADKVHTSCVQCHHTTPPQQQQQHSNAQCWCSLHLTASQLAQSHAAEQAQAARASMGATDFSASAL